MPPKKNVFYILTYSGHKINHIRQTDIYFNLTVAKSEKVWYNLIITAIILNKPIVNIIKKD